MRSLNFLRHPHGFSSKEMSNLIKEVPLTPEIFSVCCFYKCPSVLDSGEDAIDHDGLENKTKQNKSKEITRGKKKRNKKRIKSILLKGNTYACSHTRADALQYTHVYAHNALGVMVIIARNGIKDPVPAYTHSCTHL